MTDHELEIMDDEIMRPRMCSTQTSATALGWREELPDEQGYWWWWDYDGLPVPIFIAYSGTDDSYFATPNQLGWNRHQMVKDMGGLWMRLPEPDTP